MSAKNNNPLNLNEENASLRHSIALLNKNIRELIDLIKDTKFREREGF
jgi:hypothetical protein